MGWTILHHDITVPPADFFVQRFENGWRDLSTKVLDQATVGQTWYGVIQHTAADGLIQPPWAAVVLFSRHKGRFGYKELDETTGPYQAHAPARMIHLLNRLAPNPRGYAAQWRAACLANATAAAEKRKARKQYRPKAGMVLNYEGRLYTLIAPISAKSARRGWRAEREDGIHFRMKAYQIAQCIETTLAAQQATTRAIEHARKDGAEHDIPDTTTHATV